MTKQLFKALGAVGLVAALVALSVPAGAADMRAKIPFSFKVNGKTLPAGVYTFSTSQTSLLVRGYGDGAIALTNRLESRTDNQAKAIFHKYGDSYVLRQVWTGAGAGRDIPERRRAERELASFERVAIPLL